MNSISGYIKKIPIRRIDSHKGDFGKVFVVAGSAGMTGAAYLCCEGALRSGSGLVICGVPKSLDIIMETKLTEATTLPLPETKKQSLSLKAKNKILNFVKKCDVVAIGPGVGQNKETRKLIKNLVKKTEQPIVLDADGINSFKKDLRLLKKRKYRTIITPHPGEMARLIGKKVEYIQANRKETAKESAKEIGAVICLKGDGTVVAGPKGKIYINKTGNAGMATGGAGDVLTGIIASFIGQGMDDFSAAAIGVYLHGLAGDIATEQKGERSMIASDLLECLPEAFKKAGVK